MIQAGYPPKMLQEILGHASITMTLDLCGHLGVIPQMSRAIPVPYAFPLSYASLMGVLPWSSAAVERAVLLAGPKAAVRGIRALAGGTHARTYLIQTANPEREFVLREFLPGDDAVCNETRVLAALDGLDGLAPRLLASAPDASPPEGSWILISRLPGVADITPAEPAVFAHQLGETLAHIHATARDGIAGFRSVFARREGSSAALAGPTASRVAAGWQLLASRPSVLTHYDFWSGNTLWTDGILTGVVDWSGGALGPRGFDLGWCRLDLYLLYDEHVADKFLDSYRKASGAGLPDPLLSDLWAAARSHEHVESWVPNYRDLGRADLTAGELRKRHAAWTQYLIERSTNTTLYR